mgnify:CR=1 FL=1|jgi:hypothetical protein
MTARLSSPHFRLQLAARDFCTFAVLYCSILRSLTR